MTIENSSLSFFIAVVVYEATCESLSWKPFFQECFFLITAVSLEEAKEKAKTLAKQEEVSYQNEFGETVSWVVKDVVDVARTLYDSFHDGVTLYARSFHDYDAYSQFDVLLSGEDL